MENNLYAVCSWCGRKVSYHHCPVMCKVPEDAICKALNGWMSVCRINGIGDIKFYEFCSLSCIQMWAREMAPNVPEPFFKAFKEE